MVNTSLRSAGGNYAWLKAALYPRPLGSPLYFERHLHVSNYFGAISYDHISSRLGFLFARSLVANRRTGIDGHADGAADLLDFARGFAPHALSVFAPAWPFFMNRPPLRP